MVYDTGFNTKYPDHACGKVLNYCVYEDTKIFFCIYCKKVTGAAKESQINVTVRIETDAEMDEYDQKLLEDLK